jgi:hypothetical protein
VLQVSAAVSVVVPKRALGDDPRAELQQCVTERRGSRQAGDHADRSAIQHIRRITRATPQRADRDRFSICSKASSVRRELLNRFRVVRVEIAVDHSDRIRIAERAQWLPKWAAGENPAISKSESSVDRDQVHVSLQTMMVKSVVEHEYFCTEDRECMKSSSDAIAADEYRYAGSAGGQNHRLVSGDFGAAFDVLAV